MPTLIFSLIGLRVALGFIQTFVPIDVVNGWVVLSVTIFIWQVVGTLRSADRFLKDSGNMLGVFLSYFLLFITLVLTLVQVADALASKHQPEPEQIITLTLPVLTEEGAIQVDGNLDWELFGAFKQTLKDHPEIQNVQLNSTGGFVFVARAMALQIQQRKLNTHIDTHCYSACAVAFLAGESRTMAQNAELGFHQYQMESGDAQGLINVTDELERDRRFFAERGMSEAFLNRVFNAAHTEIWIPTREELIESGVLLP